MLLRLGLRKGWYVMTEYKQLDIAIRKISSIVLDIDGKWNKSEPIPGEIIRATEETYDF